MTKSRIEVKRPIWDHFFLSNAILWSKRSPDAQTQCGSVIVGKDNNLLSAGYNGFIRDADTDSLPNTRPDKYPFFLHSELNSIINAVRHGVCLNNSTIYISGQPCLQCLQTIYQAGITKVVYTDYSKPKMIESEQDNYNMVLNIMKSTGKFEIIFIPLSTIDMDTDFKIIKV